MNDDIGYFYNIIPIIDMEKFVMLLLADLASKSPITCFDNPNKKIACLKTDYKRIIEKIMYEENGWGIKFAQLIDIKQYYNNQLEWENEFSLNISKILEKLNKQITYNFLFDNIEIIFTEREINNIKSLYDEDFLKIMDHFSNLLSSYIFSRKYDLDERDRKRFINRRVENQHDILKKMMRRAGIKQL